MPLLPARTNFDDIPLASLPSSDHVSCLSCKGHGKWNYEINAYGPGKHFQGSCQQCNGRGYIHKESDEAKCIHEWKHVKNLGKCYNLYECVGCGKQQKVDSSD